MTCLISSGAKVNSISRIDSSTPLHRVVTSSNEVLTDELIKVGANVNDLDIDGESTSL